MQVTSSPSAGMKRRTRAFPGARHSALPISVSEVAAGRPMRPGAVVLAWPQSRSNMMSVSMPRVTPDTCSNSVAAPTRNATAPNNNVSQRWWSARSTTPAPAVAMVSAVFG